MPTGHVFVVASGFGVRVVPASSPCRFWLPGTEGTLRIALDTEVGARSCEITPPSSGTHVTGRIEGVADVVSGPASAEWWLETSAYRVPLPDGWIGLASGEVDPTPLDLLGPDGGLIFVQTPRVLPSIDEMVAPGQSLVGTGSSEFGPWIELRYLHDGVQWLQRHAVRSLPDLLLVLTSQAPESTYPATRATADRILRAVAPAFR